MDDPLEGCPGACGGDCQGLTVRPAAAQGAGGVEKVLLSSGLVAALFSVEKNPHKKNSGAARCGQLPDRRLFACGGGVVPLHGLQDRAVDKGVQAFPAALGVAFDHILLSLWHIHIDPVVILPDVLIDGFLLCF